MRTSAILLTLLTAAGLFAVELGQPIPLTNTRYGPIVGESAKLTTDGINVFAVVAGGGHVRFTRVGDTSQRSAPVALERTTGDAAIAWTGQAFFVASGSADGAIVGVILDRAGRRLSPQFTVVDKGYSPRLASNGSAIVMVYRQDQYGDLYAAALDVMGQVRTGPVRISGLYSDYDVASNGERFAAVNGANGGIEAHLFDEGGGYRSTTFQRVAGSQFALGSDGRNYLAVFNARSDGVMAMVIDSSRGAREPVSVDWRRNNTVASRSVVWTGDSYARSLSRKLER